MIEGLDDCTTVQERLLIQILSTQSINLFMGPLDRPTRFTTSGKALRIVGLWLCRGDEGPVRGIYRVGIQGPAFKGRRQDCRTEDALTWVHFNCEFFFFHNVNVNQGIVRRFRFFVDTVSQVSPRAPRNAMWLDIYSSPSSKTCNAPT